MKRKPRAASVVAKLLLLNLMFFRDERNKEITRYRLSTTTFKKIAGKLNLRLAFVEAVDDELKECGWLLIQRDEMTYAVIKADTIDNWSRLSAKRVNALLNSDEAEIDNEYAARFADPEDAPDED